MTELELELERMRAVVERKDLALARLIVTQRCSAYPRAVDGTRWCSEHGYQFTSTARCDLMDTAIDARSAR